MPWFSISSLFTAVASFFFGLFVLAKNYRSELNKNWFYVCLYTGFWSLGLWGVVSMHDSVHAMRFQYVLDMSAILIPVFYFRFTLFLLDIEREKRKLLALAYCLSFGLIIMSFTPLFKTGLTTPGHGLNYWIVPGRLYFIFPVYYSVLVLYSLFLLVSNLPKQQGNVRNQIRYILAAGLIGFGAGATNFFPQIMGVYPFGNYFIVLYIFIVVYAIIRYRLLGIRLILSKIYLYTMIAAFSFFFFHLAYLIDENLLGGVYSPQGLAFGVFMAFLYALAYLPFVGYVQNSSDVIFFKGYNPAKIIKDLIIDFNSEIMIKELLKVLAEGFQKVLQIGEIGILVFDYNEEKTRNWEEKEVFQNEHVLYLNKKILKKIEVDAHIIIRDELGRTDSEIAKEMDKNGTKIIAPLVFQKRLVGLVFIKTKITSEGFTREDIDFLEIMSGQASVSVANAILFKETQDFNATLKEKVDNQTKDILDKSEHLRRLLAMRTEFLNIASHQLRTPVSVIKNMLSMLAENSVPKARIAEFHKTAFEKSAKLSVIVNDILQASEMDSEKMEFSITSVDIGSLLKSICRDKKIEVENKRLKLKLSLPKIALPRVLADEKYIEQVILNLINNAIQYTQKGSITLKAEENGGYVLIRVIDTGIGIAAEDIPKLFHKFSRTQDAINTFADGSGLGLFIVKKIIKEHPDSDVWIENSELGKGTAIALKLKIADNQAKA